LLNAYAGHVNILKWLLKQKECSGNERDYYQSTPMHDAAEHGHLKLVRWYHIYRPWWNNYAGLILSIMIAKWMWTKLSTMAPISNYSVWDTDTAQTSIIQSEESCCY